jgi:hypothetical protein
MMATWMPPLFGRVFEPDSIEVKEGIAASLIIYLLQTTLSYKVNTPQKTHNPDSGGAYFSRVARINASM